MALPKKNSRTISINGEKYRYIGDASHHEGDNYGVVLIEKADDARQKIRAHFTYTKLNNEYSKVGHALSHIIDDMPPYVARQTVLYALKNGWNPDTGFGILDLGNLDDKLDFTKLKPESQDPGFRHKESVARLINGKSIENAFAIGDKRKPFFDSPPIYRTELLSHFLSKATERIALDSEHGINGQLVHGSVELWGKEEFGPWEIDKTTVVLGNFDIDGSLIIKNNVLFVAKDILVDELHLIYGEVHCLGRIIAKESIVSACNTYLYANEIHSRKTGIFGEVVCKKVNSRRRFCNESSALSKYKNKYQD